MSSNRSQIQDVLEPKHTDDFFESLASTKKRGEIQSDLMSMNDSNYNMSRTSKLIKYAKSKFQNIRLATQDYSSVLIEEAINRASSARHTSGKRQSEENSLKQASSKQFSFCGP